MEQCQALFARKYVLGNGYNFYPARVLAIEFVCLIFLRTFVLMLPVFTKDGQDLSHESINYQWGMFHPSVWYFSIWQAFNKARMINAYIDGKKVRHAKLTGLFFGMTFGSNICIYLHYHFNVPYFLLFLQSPIIFGAILGILFRAVGHIVEKRFY